MELFSYAAPLGLELFWCPYPALTLQRASALRGCAGLPHFAPYGAVVFFGRDFFRLPDAISLAKLESRNVAFGSLKTLGIPRCARDRNYFTSSSTPTQTSAAESQRRRSTFSCSRNLARMAEQM